MPDKMLAYNLDFSMHQHLPAIGARNTEYPDIKLKKVSASERIFQGTMTQQETTAAITHPLLILIYLGAMTHISFAAEIELAVIFVPTCAIYQLNAAKKAAALPADPLLSHCATISKGFQ